MIRVSSRTSTLDTTHNSGLELKRVETNEKQSDLEDSDIVEEILQMFIYLASHNTHIKENTRKIGCWTLIGYHCKIDKKEQKDTDNIKN